MEDPETQKWHALIFMSTLIKIKESFHLAF